MKRFDFPNVYVIGVKKAVIIIQGGMGMRVSCPELFGAVCREGAIGVLSSAGLSDFYIENDGKRATARDAARYEVEAAIEKSRMEKPFVAINIMGALRKDFEASVRGSIEGGVSAIISGAGLPTSLPGIVQDMDALGEVALIPIVSSMKATRAICNRWWRDFGYIPDAIIIEGEKAGGHLGFKAGDIGKEENKLENIFAEVRQFLDNFCQDKDAYVPIIVAGGIFYHEDILYWVDEIGADGVQMGSRFAATKESGASQEFKDAIVAAKEEDIIISDKSPCGFPFRVIKTSPGYQDALNNPQKAKCKRGYVLQKNQETGKFDQCPAKDDCKCFCICGVLIAAAGGKSEQRGVFTIGSRGHLIDKIISVKDLMDELGVIG